MAPAGAALEGERTGVRGSPGVGRTGLQEEAPGGRGRRGLKGLLGHLILGTKGQLGSYLLAEVPGPVFP